MKAVGIPWIWNRINAEHFKSSLKEHLVGKEQGTDQGLILLELLVERNADATPADVDGSWDHDGFSRVGCLLQTNRQGDGDAVVLSTISRRWRRCRGVGWHGAEEYTKISERIH